MKKITLSSAGCGKMGVNLGDIGIYTFITRYNYTAQCWALDILDSLNDALLTGLMLVPGVDILSPHPAVAEVIGSLYFVETNVGDYMLPTAMDKGAFLAWYPVAGVPLS